MSCKDRLQPFLPGRGSIDSPPRLPPLPSETPLFRAHRDAGGLHLAGCTRATRPIAVAPGGKRMNVKIALLGLLLSGFFAVACLRAAAAPASARAMSALGLVRFPGRLERLRHSRGHRVPLVALMLVLRLQDQLPPLLAVMAPLD